MADFYNTLRALCDDGTVASEITQNNSLFFSPPRLVCNFKESWEQSEIVGGKEWFLWLYSLLPVGKVGHLKESSIVVFEMDTKKPLSIPRERRLYSVLKICEVIKKPRDLMSFKISYCGL